MAIKQKIITSNNIEALAILTRAIYIKKKI